MNIDLLSGKPLGPYELRELLGSGGMGAVYRAIQTNLKREVAIKVLSAALSQQPGYLERFNREAKVAAALEHPHIVPVYDYGTHDNVSYVVMRLLSGGSLTDRLRRATIEERLPSIGEVSDLLRQLAGALDYAHSRGVIHRDIKPSNVMFDTHGNAYIVDFGIAKLLDATSGLTGTGQTLGTPSYMPPEQWRDDELTAAADQYALGVLVYNMLTGRLPFEASTPFALMHKHLHEVPAPIHAFRKELPQAMTFVLERAMAKLPEDRFQTVTAFAQAFDSATEGIKGEATGFFFAKAQPRIVDDGPTVTPPAQQKMPTPTPPYVPSPASRVTAPPMPAAPLTSTVPVAPPRRSPLVWVLLAVIILLLGAIAALVVLSPRGDDTTPTPTSVAAAQVETSTTDATSAPPTPIFALTDEALPTSDVSESQTATEDIPTEPVIVIQSVTEEPAQTQAVVVPTETDEPTNEPEPTDTAVDIVVVVSDTPEPAATDTEPPTDTPTDEPTTTPQPTDTPTDEPTGTMEPSATPVPPTQTHVPSETPVPPTETVQPTNTPEPPTATVAPSATPVPPSSTPAPTQTPLATETPLPPPTVELVAGAVTSVSLNFDDTVIGSGWSAEETTDDGTTYVWMNRPEATVSFLLQPGLAYSIKFRVLDEIEQHIMNSLRLTVNGTPIPLEYIETESGARVYDAEIPAEVITAERTLLRFQISHVISPMELGQNNDARTLGISFDWLRIEASGGMQLAGNPTPSVPTPIPPTPDTGTGSDTTMAQVIGQLTLGQAQFSTLETGAGDGWTFEGRSGDQLLISLASGQFDPVLDVYDPNGDFLATSDDDGGLTNSFLNLTLTMDGIYTAVARGYDEAQEGEYVLLAMQRPFRSINFLPPETAIQTLVQGALLDAKSGSLWEELDAQILDLTGRESSLIWMRSSNPYGNFVNSVTVHWGPGPAEDSCGIIFREADEENYYVLEIDRNGTLWFSEKFHGEWQPAQSMPANGINTSAGAANHMTLIVDGDTFTLIINNGTPHTFTDNSTTFGNVGINMTSIQGVVETRCIFTDLWLWSLD